MAVVLSVLDYGAVGDGFADDSPAFARALVNLSARGGGTLVVPGHRPPPLRQAYYIVRQPFVLISNLVLHLQAGATIVAQYETPDYGTMSDTHFSWSVTTGVPNLQPQALRAAAVVVGKSITNVTIQGQGDTAVLDGNGAYWWEAYRRHNSNHTPSIQRPHLLELQDSKHIRLYDFRMVNSPFWTNHFFNCDDVHVRGVTIQAPEHSPNTDGWDPNSSRNVLIEDSNYSGGDDCVAIKSGWDCFGIDYNVPCVNITVRNVTCHGFSAGITIGSELSGGVEQVLIENITYTKANKVVHIKTSRRRGAYVRDVTYRNILVTGSIQRGVHVDMFHYDDSPKYVMVSVLALRECELRNSPKNYFGSIVLAQCECISHPPPPSVLQPCLSHQLDTTIDNCHFNFIDV
jgi:polygalacturonase